MARYTMTARRRAALRKAQLASARKRRRRAVGAATVGFAAGAIVARHKLSRSRLTVQVGQRKGSKPVRFRYDSFEPNGFYKVKIFFGQAGTKKRSMRVRYAHQTLNKDDVKMGVLRTRLFAADAILTTKAFLR
jgi:hypothetical protein